MHKIETNPENDAAIVLTDASLRFASGQRPNIPALFIFQNAAQWSPKADSIQADI